MCINGRPTASAPSVTGNKKTEKMIDFNEYYHRIANNYKTLQKEFNFKSMEISPCTIQSKSGLELFVRKIMQSLFDISEIKFVETDLPNSRIKNQVNFYANHKLITLKIDERYGHIEIDFFKVLDQIAEQYGKIIRQVHNEQLYVVGTKEEMIKAWQKGFPIHIYYLEFLYKHFNGKRFKKNELGSSLVINQRIAPNYYKEIVLNELNKLLEKRKEEIRFSLNQILLYENGLGKIYLSLNGGYDRGFEIIGDNTIFDNCILSQIFLKKHLDLNNESNVKFVNKEGIEEQVDGKFEELLEKFGSKT